MKTVLLGATLLALAACSQQSAKQPAIDAVDRTAEFVPTPADDLGDKVASYDGPIPRPIRIGSDGPRMDACGTYSEVANLNPKGDNYLSVRDAPSTSTKERDRLNPGQGVSVCDRANGWSGIVYSKEGDEEQDCGTGTNVATEQNYTGPCRQGWVDSRYLEMIAG